VDELRPNHLVLRIQPEGGMRLTFIAKQPGPDVRVQQASMDFAYRDSFMTEPAEAYERLLHDAMDGEHTLFTREDGVERAWMIVQPVLEDPHRSASTVPVRGARRKLMSSSRPAPGTYSTNGTWCRPFRLVDPADRIRSGATLSYVQLHPKHV